MIQSEVLRKLMRYEKKYGRTSFDVSKDYVVGNVRKLKKEIPDIHDWMDVYATYREGIGAFVQEGITNDFEIGGPTPLTND